MVFFKFSKIFLLSNYDLLGLVTATSSASAPNNLTQSDASSGGALAAAAFEEPSRPHQQSVIMFATVRFCKSTSVTVYFSSISRNWFGKPNAKNNLQVITIFMLADVMAKWHHRMGG